MANRSGSMKPLSSASPDNVLSETVLLDFARHLRSTHFLIVFAAVFMVAVSFQLPISPIEKSVRDINGIKVLQQIALTDSPVSQTNFLGLIVTPKLKLTSSSGTESLPILSLVSHNKQTLSIKWRTVLPLVETIPSLSLIQSVSLQSISKQHLHSVQTFDDFRKLWDWHHRKFFVHMPFAIANTVLVIDKPLLQDQLSASIRDLQSNKTLLKNQSNELVLQDAVFVGDINPSRLPFVPFSLRNVSDYLKKTKDDYNILLVFHAPGPDMQNPTTVLVSIFAERMQIHAQSQISLLANASWPEGPFEKSFSDLQAIMPMIKDNMIDTFDIDQVRRIYPNESNVEQQEVNILGMTINGIQMMSWGPWLIVALQLYFYILCRQIYHTHSNSWRALVFPWIGLSRDTIGRIAYFVSIILLPAFTLFRTVGVLQYSPISQYQVLIYLRYVAVILGLFTTKIIIFEDWRKSGRVGIERRLL